jgi:hypothetical protein
MPHSANPIPLVDSPFREEMHDDDDDDDDNDE